MEFSKQKLLDGAGEHSSTGGNHTSDIKVPTFEKIYERIKECKCELLSIQNVLDGAIKANRERMRYKKEELGERYNTMTSQQPEVGLKHWCLLCGKRTIENHLNYCSQECKEQYQYGNQLSIVLKVGSLHFHRDSHIEIQSNFHGTKNGCCDMRQMPEKEKCTKQIRFLYCK
ncbi:hypothetical protein GQX74_014208 [Glossina fuscipes]|nr:hypothetical protein GQX74_014208 [Glossina fuscipes]